MKSYQVDLSEGEFMQVMRQRKGLTQDDVAKLAGCSRSAVAMAERGTATPQMTAWVMGFIVGNHNTVIGEGQGSPTPSPSQREGGIGGNHVDA